MESETGFRCLSCSESAVCDANQTLQCHCCNFSSMNIQGAGMSASLDRWVCTVKVTVTPNPTVHPGKKFYIKISLLTNHISKSICWVPKNRHCVRSVPNLSPTIPNPKTFKNSKTWSELLWWWTWPEMT